ncbi:MAG: hypothetical protein LQ346_004937 [Caloplaca aetnensis]|nr:MAG: hypothetical protein LQ346_004937 [Caloplaca aetnensis]
MATNSQKVRKTSAHSATIQPRGEDVKRRLLRESFERILDILHQISLHEKSPKLFIIYAHNNKSTGFDAYQETVKEYISWFKKIGFNVDSDKSPHGYGVAHEIGHRGASTDIFTNQVCLLPRTWHEQNVDYVLVFYSKVLATYMKYERGFKIEDTTYSEAICKTCEDIQKSLQDRSQEQWNSACDKIRIVQQRFSQAMKNAFHHVLTETALLSFTNRNAQLDKTIPVIFSDEEGWEPELEWQPHFLHNKETKLRITIKPDEDYQQFFKILLGFETLERDRPAIEVMMKSFQDSVKLLEKDPQPEEYRSQSETLIANAMQNLNRQWQKIERPITRDDIRSRLALYSKLDVASIRRISGQRFVRDIEDIDLAVTESTDPQIRNPEDEEREKAKEKEKEIRQNVTLHSLFNERKIKNKTIRPKRILIQGKPGIGKTTLCRRLMYEYLWNEGLRTKFDLVVRIPARKLEHSVDLGSLFFEEYFEDAPNGHTLSKKLEDLVLAHETANSENQDNASRKILLVLDGLDEIMRYSQGRQALLEKLMKAPAVIITSRFHDLKMPYTTIDLHLEALGLSITNVDAYLDNKTFVAEDSARQIRQVIEASASVMDMIRVPIHLDIVCYGWDQLHGHNSASNAFTNEGATSTPTMATLYQSVVRSLWRQDVPFLGKMDHGELVTAETINTVHDIARLDRLVNMENDLLEELAIKMLESERIEFTNRDVAKVIQQWESNGNQVPLSLESRIHKFSLLRSSSREGYRTFRFVHLTFQDFFTARYIARSLVQEPSRLRNLLRRYKYNRQYELFWRFIPGLLKKSEDLDLFFQLLDQEPRDLLGIQHIRLVMHCWHEWPVRLRSRLWEGVMKRLEDWQELECRLGYCFGIGSSTVFPEHILARKLELSVSKTLKIDENFLGTICNRISLSEDIIRSIIQLSVKHKFHCGIRALEMPLSRGLMDDILKSPTNWYFRVVYQNAKLPESSISFFMEKIRDAPSRTPSGRLLYNADEILAHQRTLPKEVVEELEKWFRSEGHPLSSIANSILKAQSQDVTLSQNTLDHAVEQLIKESDDHKLGWNHSWVLGRRDLPPETVAKIVAWLLQRTRTVSYICYPTISLHSDNVEKMGVLLDMCLHHDQLREKDFDSLWCILDPPEANNPKARVPLIEIKRMVRFALYFLEGQPSLPTNILKMVVRILDWSLKHFYSDYENGFFKQIRDAAQHILQEQPELHRDVIVELQDMFNNNGKETAVAALRGHLHLFTDAFRWALARAAHYLTQQAMENHHERDLRQILEILSDEPDLPEEFVDSLVYSLPKMLEGGIWLLGTIPKLYKRQVFAETLVDALCKASTWEQVKLLASTLALQDNLDPKLLGRLMEHLQYGWTFLDLWGRTPYPIIRIFARQSELDRKSIVALNNILSDKKISCDEFWNYRHLEQFVTCLEFFEPHIIVRILKSFLYRRAENITPAYIHGNTLHYQAADGKMKSLLLKDERSFRKRFSEAQRLVGLPQWSCIDQFPEEGCSNPSVEERVNPEDGESTAPVAKRIRSTK